MFKKSRFVSVALAAIAGALAFPQQYSSASVPDTCTVPLALAVDGTKGPHTPTSIDPASPLSTVAGDYRALGYAVEHVEYTGGILAGWTQNYDDSVAIGLSQLRDRIDVQEHTCSSSTRYVLLGYSQGARIAARVQIRRYTDPRQPKTGIEVAGRRLGVHDRQRRRGRSLRNHRIHRGQPGK